MLGETMLMGSAIDAVQRCRAYSGGHDKAVKLIGWTLSGSGRPSGSIG